MFIKIICTRVKNHSKDKSEVKKFFFTLNYKIFFTENKNCYKIQITKHRIINQGFIGYIGIYMH